MIFHSIRVHVHKKKLRYMKYYNNLKFKNNFANEITFLIGIVKKN